MPNQPSTSAKILYRPVGLISSVLGGVIAGTIFKQVWKRAAPGTKDDPPKALETEYPVQRDTAGRRGAGSDILGRQDSDRPPGRPPL